MAEWSKAVDSKSIIPSDWDRGFESPSLLQPTFIRAFRLGKLRLAGQSSLFLCGVYAELVEAVGTASFL